MRNPHTWDQFCACFDCIVEECLPYHREVIQSLIDSDLVEGCPNILFYNAEGFPADLLIDYMFRKKHGDFTRRQCQVNSEMEYFHTPWFLEFDFHHPNFLKQSTECIDLIKQIIQVPTVDGNRHVIVLKNVDGAVLVAKQMFRVLLERYSKNALFICTTTAISKIEAPLKSRFMLVRLPLVTQDEMRAIIHHLGYSYQENYQVGRNLYSTLLVIDLIQTGASNDIDSLCKFHFPLLATLKQDPTFESIRTMTNKICQTNIPVRCIVSDLLQLIPNPRLKMDFIIQAADIEHMLASTNGGRQMLYIEKLLHTAVFGNKTMSSS